MARFFLISRRIVYTIFIYFSLFIVWLSTLHLSKKCSLWWRPCNQISRNWSLTSRNWSQVWRKSRLDFDHWKRPYEIFEMNSVLSLRTIASSSIRHSRIYLISLREKMNPHLYRNIWEDSLPMTILNCSIWSSFWGSFSWQDFRRFPLFSDWIRRIQYIDNIWII